MTPSEALEQVAVEFEQRREKLIDAATRARGEGHWGRYDAAERANKAYVVELDVQTRGLTWAIDRLRDRAKVMRDAAGNSFADEFLKLSALEKDQSK